MGGGGRDVVIYGRRLGSEVYPTSNVDMTPSRDDHRIQTLFMAARGNAAKAVTGTACCITPPDLFPPSCTDFLFE